jgi:hypothetical protein
MGGKRQATRKKAPESWIGRRVQAAMSFGGGPYAGTLEEANDRGIVLRYEMEDGEGVLFVPWTEVGWISLLDEPQS